MEEGQVTIDGTTMVLPRPFFVIATQNPIELEGTFPLPEAQMDRFLLRVELGYPSREEECLILERFQETDPLLGLQAVTTSEEVLKMQRERRSIRVSPSIKDYIVGIVEATRQSRFLRFGASPRCSLHLMRASQAYAALSGRQYVLPDDVKFLAGPVLIHRLILRNEEKIRGITVQKIIEELIAGVPVPGAEG
jgi:MoxR-like ATPase